MSAIVHPLRGLAFRSLGRDVALSPFARFAAVGSVGFAVDLCVCKLLIACGVPPLLGRIPAMLLGLAATFLFNRGVTVPAQGSLRDQALRYGVANATVAVLNYTVFAVALLGTHGLLPLAALAVGSGAGFAVSLLDVKHRARVAAANDDQRDAHPAV